MANITEILDELSWAVSTDSLPDAEGLASILENLRALEAFPAESLPEGLPDILGDVIALAQEAKSDEKKLMALRNTLSMTFADFVAMAAESAGADSLDGDDILQVFIASCGDGLSDLERALLAHDGGEEGLLDEIKRGMHTIKGECGVLSLHAAQDLWHEAETMIEDCLENGSEVRVDPLMGLVDWMRDYVELLASNPNSPPPDATELASAFSAAPPEEPTEAPAAAPAPAAPVLEGLVSFSEETLADETIPEFITESQVHLEDSEAALLELENDPSSADSIDRIFRAFHTIKGVAGFLELDPISRVAHSAETLLDKFRQGGIEFHGGHADLVLESKDMLAQLLDALTGETGPSAQGHADLIARLEAAAADPASVGANGASAVASALADAGLNSAEDIAAAAADAAETTSRLGDVLVERGIVTEEQIQQALTKQAENAAGGRPMRIGEVLVEAGAITKEQLDEALSGQGAASQFGKLLETPIEASQPELKPQAAPQPKATPAPPAKSGGAKKAAMDSTIRVNTQRLDALVDMVGELVIAQQMVMQGTTPFLAAADDTLSRNLTHLGKITRDLQEASMSLRMVTFRSTFQKMHRLVRDVAAKASKKVRLVVEGAETEVDRNVVDRISDPLVHLVRNAIDHGLEEPSDRMAAGKAPEGTVILSARHQGGAIVISLKDDGRGLAREKIIAKAMERGLLPPGVDPSELSDGAVNRLIFEPGFSTAAQVTDISGRGVGMDVVKRNIEAMRGKIEIESTPGEGTTFQIHLPLTLAIIDAMIVRSGEDRFVIPTLSIVQSFQPEGGQLHTLQSRTPMVEVRGQLVPVCSLSEAIGRVSDFQDPGSSTLILVEAMNRRACLVVDEIIGQQQVVIKKLGSCMPTLPVISGGAILGDGRVALIVDTEGVLAHIDSTQAA